MSAFIQMSDHADFDICFHPKHGMSGFCDIMSVFNWKSVKHFQKQGYPSQYLPLYPVKQAHSCNKARQKQNISEQQTQCWSI